LHGAKWLVIARFEITGLAIVTSVPDTGWTEVVALVAAYLIAVATTPAGISGAVLLLPFQVSVLSTPGPSVTPTNLLYNIIATPGAAGCGSP
jgi:hypothetical protein